MRNPNKPIKSLDDRIKTNEEIAEMVKNMLNNDENGNPEKKEQLEAV